MQNPHVALRLSIRYREQDNLPQLAIGEGVLGVRVGSHGGASHAQLMKSWCDP